MYIELTETDQCADYYYTRQGLAQREDYAIVTTGYYSLFRSRRDAVFIFMGLTWGAAASHGDPWSLNKPRAAGSRSWTPFHDLLRCHSWYSIPQSDRCYRTWYNILPILLALSPLLLLWWLLQGTLFAFPGSQISPRQIINVTRACTQAHYNVAKLRNFKTFTFL